MWNYHTASPDRYQLLKEFARINRKNQTEAESALWKVLRHQFLNTKVLRQHIIGDYIVDFLLPYYKLVIEVDGGYHAERSQQEDDALRSMALYKQGYYVMRFKNEQVLVDIESVIEQIKHIISKIDYKQ